MNAIELEARYSAPNYAPLPVVLTRGEGAHLWDTAGRRYVDLMSAYSAASHGHAHPRILAALTAQATRLAVPSRAYYNDRLGPFLEELCKLTGLDAALPMNTGAEAVETAIKAARRWGYRVKGIARDRAEIIVANGNFHGRTTTVISFSTEPDYRDGFGPFTPGFRAVPFGDLAAIERAITPETAAVLIEPIQGEAGIIAGYHAVVELGRLARPVNVFAEINLEKQANRGRFEKRLAAIDAVVECWEVSGTVDYIARFVCADLAEYEELTSALLDDDRLGAARIVSHVALRPVRRFTGYPETLLGRDPAKR